MNKFFITVLIFILNCMYSYAEIIQDEVADSLTVVESNSKVFTSYNFESTTKIPIKLKIIETIKSEEDVFEGQEIEFKVARDCIYKEKMLLERGTIVKAKISTIITSGMNGIPASIIFSDFETDSIKKEQLSPTIEVFGQDRSLLVYPLKWALTILPPSGSLTNFIKGGHVKLKDEKIITIYYYPNW